MQNTGLDSGWTVAPSENASDEAVEVVVGVVFNEKGEVLVNQRTYPADFAGKWEFPGGKIEAGETIHKALHRELMEEVNIDIALSEPLISITHSYVHAEVRLHVRKVTNYRGKPAGREGQKISWVPPDGLRNMDFLEANEPILNAVCLPHYYLITNTAEFGDVHTLQTLEDLLSTHRCMVQMREKSMGSRAFQRFAERLISLCHCHGVPVMANAEPQVAIDLGFDGVHLSSIQLKRLTERPGSRGFWVGASCHDTSEIELAHRLGVDFAAVSPIMQTGTHPTESPIGWHQLRQYCSMSRIPLFALGGVGFDDVTTAREAGAQGVAMIRAAWQE